MTRSKLIAFDPLLMRPASVAVALAMGGDATLPLHFDAVDLLTEPTRYMKLFPVDQSEIAGLIAKVRARRLAQVAA